MWRIDLADNVAAWWTSSSSGPCNSLTWRIYSCCDDWTGKESPLRRIVFLLEGLLPTFHALIHKRGKPARSNVRPFSNLSIHSWTMLARSRSRISVLSYQLDWVMINCYGSRSSSRGCPRGVKVRTVRYFGGAACNVHQPITEAARWIRVIERALGSARQIGSVRVSGIAFVCREPDTASRPPTFVRSDELSRNSDLGSLRVEISLWVTWSACRIFFFFLFFSLSLYTSPTSRANVEQRRCRAIITRDPECRGSMSGIPR